MKKLIQYYKDLYGFENWSLMDSQEESVFRTFSPHLEQESVYQRVAQNVFSQMWGDSLYTHCETLQKGDLQFLVKIWPYYTVEKAKEGMLLRMISSVPFEKAKDIQIGDLCYTHPCLPGSYLLFLYERTMIEISVPGGGEHMDDIMELASLIINQMKEVRKRTR